MFIGGLSWQTTPGTESKDIHDADDFSFKLWRFFYSNSLKNKLRRNVDVRYCSCTCIYICPVNTNLLYHSSPICCMFLQFHPWKFDSWPFVLKFKKLVLFINEVGNLSFIHKWGWTVGNTSLQLSCIPLHKMKHKTELQTFWFRKIEINYTKLL